MNEGPFRIALRAGNGGYSVVREPSEGQKVAAVLRDEEMPTEQCIDRGPLRFADARAMVARLTRLHDLTSN